MKGIGVSARNFLADQSYRFSDRSLALPAAYFTIGLGDDLREGLFAPRIICGVQWKKMASSESVKHVVRGSLSFDSKRCQHITYGEN